MTDFAELLKAHMERNKELIEMLDAAAERNAEGALRDAHQYILKSMHSLKGYFESAIKDNSPIRSRKKRAKNEF